MFLAAFVVAVATKDEATVALENAGEMFAALNSCSDGDNAAFDKAFSEFEEKQRALFASWQSREGQRSIAIKHSQKILDIGRLFRWRRDKPDLQK